MSTIVNHGCCRRHVVELDQPPGSRGNWRADQSIGVLIASLTPSGVGQPGQPLHLGRIDRRYRASQPQTDRFPLRPGLQANGVVLTPEVLAGAGHQILGLERGEGRIEALWPSRQRARSGADQTVSGQNGRVGPGRVREGRTMSNRELPTEAEIDAARTPAGGWTKDQLAQWGVPWPPPKGWRKRLVRTSVCARRPGDRPPQ